MGTARPLYKVDHAMSCEQKLAKERVLRKNAEANALRFHALLMEARVALIVAKAKEGS